VANVFGVAQPGSASLRYRTPMLARPLAVVPFVLWGLAFSILRRSRPRPVAPEPETQLLPILTATGS
jgi:hypothetical protein